MFYQFFLVGLGGAFGAMMRVALAQLLPTTLFCIPAPILCINVLGCFAMGFLNTIFFIHWPTDQNIRYFLLSGFLGGLTTFSSFALECGTLLTKQEYFTTSLYVGLSIMLSIIFFFVGSNFGRFF